MTRLSWEQRSTIEGTAAHSWAPTALLLQAVLTGGLCLLIAVLTRRPDVLVLAVPFVVVTAWMLVTRPSQSPVATVSLTPTRLREGQSARWAAKVTSETSTDHVVALLHPTPEVGASPDHGEAAAVLTKGEAQVSFDLQAIRWGSRRMGDATFTYVSPWCGFRYGPSALSGNPVLAAPEPDTFALAAPSPHPDGLVGLNRSRRRGDGHEFAEIRQFRSGDRLKHIHWPVSARTGELHVRTSYAEQDAEVHLVIDAVPEVGVSGGIDGTPSSADLSVRAAAALAHHLLRRGERVGLTVHAASTTQVPVGLGQPHLRRITDALAMTRLVVVQSRRQAKRPPLRAGSGALIIVLSPLVGKESLDQALRLHAHGHTVVVVDCLPPGVNIDADGDPALQRAWRLRMLERAADVSGLQRLGIPVVAWRGPGSLDLVLQRLSAAPRPRVRRG